MLRCLFFFFFNDTATTEIYTLSLHDALPICIAAASLIAFLCGEFVNSFVLAKMKILTRGRWLWTRTIGSTIFGEGVDSLIFYPLAFFGSGLIPDDRLPQIMLVQFVSKVGLEVAFTPLTYTVAGWLKRAEQEDYYDRDTDFNPFTLKT